MDITDQPGGDAVRRFRDSMTVTQEMWHDGIGYDLGILQQASADDRAAIEGMLLARGVHDWRDVEALLAVGTDAALAAVAEAGSTASTEVRLAVAGMAPQLVPAAERTAALVDALRTATLLDGLSTALDQAAEFHPPAVVRELLRGALVREGAAAVHFAALLMFIHGVTGEPFDWAERPFFLRFDSTGVQRRQAFDELCARIGLDPDPAGSFGS